MDAPKQIASKEITDAFIDEVCDRIAGDHQVRRGLPEHGRLNIDRKLPFLLVYRSCPGAEARGTDRLVTSEASYMIAPGSKAHRAMVSRLTERIAATLAPVFGAFLIVEIWSTRRDAADVEDTVVQPGFRIILTRAHPPASTIEELSRALGVIKVQGRPALVDVHTARSVAPPKLPELLERDRLEAVNAQLVGIQVDPVQVDLRTGEFYPMVLQRLRRQFSRALQKGFFEFSCTHTAHAPTHYQALGRKAVSRTVWEVDERLARISESFDFLIQVTPTNLHAAWREFRRSRFEHAPRFDYRRIPIDPELMKRGLFNIPLETIEDPTLAHLFRERQEEIDRQVTMLRDRGTWRFVHGSIALYGGVRPGLLETARNLLERLPRRQRSRSREQVDAREFVALAMQEYEYYRSVFPEFKSGADIRDDIGQTLMVSAGRLLVGRGMKIPKSRANALLQHEVGTHVLTYCNGHTQRLRQLYCGLAGYDEFQEGIAVLAEYLVGGLGSDRLRVLAARVLGVHAMIEGASFVDVFRLLNRQHGFAQRSAFTIAMRIYRGGGLTKDAIYLRGLDTVLRYLRDGGAIEPLFVGKIAAHHIPIIRELQLRKVLNPAPLLPRYMSDPAVGRRLEGVRTGTSILELAASNVHP